MNRELLLDTIPFRCPKCGNTKSFSTMTELRVHLSSEHSLSPSKRDGTKVFNYGRSREQSPLLQAFQEEGKRLEEEVRKAKEQERQNKLLQDEKLLRDRVYLGYGAPFTATVDDRHLKSALSSLSNEVTARREQQYRTADNLYATRDILDSVEQAAEVQRLQQHLALSRLAGQLRPGASPQQTSLPGNVFVTAAEVHQPSQTTGAGRLPLQVPPSSGVGDLPSADLHGSTFAKASQLEQAQAEIQRLKESQRQLMDSIEQLRQRADVDNQTLIQGLRSRERQLQQINQHLGSISPRHQAVSPTVPSSGPNSGASDNVSCQLRAQIPQGSPQGKRRQLEPDEIPVRDSSPYGDEHHVRPTHVKSLLPKVQNKEKDEKSRSEKLSPRRKLDFEDGVRQGDEPRHKDEQRQRDSTRHRDEHLVALQRRSERLEEDRQLLLQEMENLLSRAASGNEKLRSELHAKEGHLQQLNKELQQAKLGQSELLGETIELYSQADANISKLKELLLVKEEQLTTANLRLGQMRDVQNQAISEKEMAAREAQSQCQHLQSTLRAMEERLASTQAELRRLMEERDRGLQEAARLQSQASSQQSTNARLQENLSQQEKQNQALQADIECREKQLADTKKNLDSVTDFIKTTAAKELEARTKLEKFITDLIDRADGAERQLRTMRKEMEGPSSAVSPEKDWGHLSAQSQPVSRTSLGRQQATTDPQPSSLASDSLTLSSLRKLPTSEIKSRAKQVLQRNLKPWQPDLTSPASTQPPKPPSGHPGQRCPPAVDESALDRLDGIVLRSSGLEGRYPNGIREVPHEQDSGLSSREPLHGHPLPLEDYEGHYVEVDFQQNPYQHPARSGQGFDEGRVRDAHYSGSEAELLEPMYASIAKRGVRSPRNSTPLPLLPPSRPPALPDRDMPVRGDAGRFQQTAPYLPHPSFLPPHPGGDSHPPSYSVLPEQGVMPQTWHGRNLSDAMDSPSVSFSQKTARNHQNEDPRLYVSQYNPSEAYYKNSKPGHHNPNLPPPQIRSRSPYLSQQGGHAMSSQSRANNGFLLPAEGSHVAGNSHSPEWMHTAGSYPVLEESGYGSHYRTMPSQADLQASPAGCRFDSGSGEFVDGNSFDPSLRTYSPSHLSEKRWSVHPHPTLVDAEDDREGYASCARNPSLRARQNQTTRKRDKDLDHLRSSTIQPTASFESDSGWDGRELSVDENGILWDNACDATWTEEWDDLDSCRISPSGSETAGDVDSSLLLSGSSSSPNVLTRGSPPQEKSSSSDHGLSLDEKFAKFLGKDWRKSLGGQKLPPVKEEIPSHEYTREKVARERSALNGKGRNVDSEKNVPLKSYSSGHNGACDRRSESSQRGRKDIDEQVAPVTVSQVYSKPRMQNHAERGISGRPQQDSQAETPGFSHSRTIDQKSEHTGKPVVHEESYGNRNRTTGPNVASEKMTKKEVGTNESSLRHGNSSRKPADMTDEESKVGKSRSLALGSFEILESPQDEKDQKLSSQLSVRTQQKNAADELTKSNTITSSTQPPHLQEDKMSSNVVLQHRAGPSIDSVTEKNEGKEGTHPAHASGNDDSPQLALSSPARTSESRRGSLVKQKSLYPESLGAGKLEPSAVPGTSNHEGDHSTRAGGNGNHDTEAAVTVEDRGHDVERMKSSDAVRGKKMDGAVNSGAGKTSGVDQLQDQHSPQGEVEQEGKAVLPGDPYVLTEEEMADFAKAPRKRAQPLRPRFQIDSRASSDDESSNPTEAIKESLHRVGSEESSDLDFESDFEKVGNPVLAARASIAKRAPVHRGVVARRRNKMVRRNPAAAPATAILAVATDEESAAMSDVDDPRKQRKEEARRRRIALFHVFTYLDTRTLCYMSQVCREWKRVSRHASLWKRVTLKNERISSEFLATLSQWCTQLHTLTLEGLRVRARRDNETVEEYNQNTRAVLEAGLEQLLKASQNSLRCLTILDCSNVLTDKSLWLAGCYSRLLERLTYVSDTDPVGPELLFALGGGCPGVTSLVIPPLYPCSRPAVFTNKCLLLIGKFYRDLLVLGVGGREINIGGLLPLVQSCQRLQQLQLDHTVEMTADMATALCRAGLKNLQELNLTGTPVSDKAIKAFHKSCKHLTKIQILVTIRDYFEDTSTKKSRDAYKKAIDSLRKLEKQPGLGNILTIQAAPAE